MILHGMKTHAATLVALVVLVAACGSPAGLPPSPPPTPAPPPAPSMPPAPEVAITASVDTSEILAADCSRLAGLPVGGDTGEVGLEWARHAELMEDIWARVEERHLGPMRSWAETELDLADTTAPLYYPFSGPDLPSALQFFPAASSYVLVGLEPPGRIPDLEGFGGDALATELERLRDGLKNLAEAGYFVTKRMETDFVAPQLEGLLPMLYIFLARAGLTPKSVGFIRLDDQGTAIPLEAATERSATAVRIELGDGDNKTSRWLYYFSRDLSNSGLASTPAFVAFLRRLGAFNVYMKSASYLLHMQGFTAHKEFLTAHAGTVLQDDSGIPLRDLPSTLWHRRYFGTYTRTLPSYREWFQEDLKAVFEQAGSLSSGNLPLVPDRERSQGDPALPFAIGYHSKIGGSCLIWAERRGQ